MKESSIIFNVQTTLKRIVSSLLFSRVSFHSGLFLLLQMVTTLFPTSINIGVPYGCVVSPTLILLFINDFLSLTHYHVHSYADDSTLYFSRSFVIRPTLQKSSNLRRDATNCLTSDLSILSEWGRASFNLFNLVFHLPLDKTFKTTILSLLMTLDYLLLDAELLRLSDTLSQLELSHLISR